MKKRLMMPAVLMLILLCLALPAAAEGGEEGTAEWTVMFYLCGTDLGETERLAEYFDRYFKYLGELYATDPEKIKAACSYLSAAFEFGMAESSMIDLGGIFYQPYVPGTLERELYYGMTDALADAVVYNIHSSGRSGAHGLSFCDAFGFSVEERIRWRYNGRDFFVSLS